MTKSKEYLLVGGPLNGRLFNLETTSRRIKFPTFARRRFISEKYGYCCGSEIYELQTDGCFHHVGSEGDLIIQPQEEELPNLDAIVTEQT